jgi:hypothetical protein
MGMSVRATQREVDSPAFAEWIAYWLVKAELEGGAEREPTPDELGGKISAWAAMHNVRKDAR